MTIKKKKPGKREDSHRHHNLQMSEEIAELKLYIAILQEFVKQREFL